MKIKVMVLSCLIGVVVLSMSYEGSLARPEPEAKADKASLKIGVVSIRKIFRECKRNAKYREETMAERDKALAELEKLSKEIEAGRAGLKTLKPGSDDHLVLMKELLEKQGALQAQQEFLKQQIALKQQRMVEDIYGDILQMTGEVAKEKGLDLVFENSKPELSELNANELELVMGTHKLLYSGGCLDITNEVMVRVDAGN